MRGLLREARATSSFSGKRIQPISDSALQKRVNLIEYINNPQNIISLGAFGTVALRGRHRELRCLFLAICWRVSGHFIVEDVVFGRNGHFEGLQERWFVIGPYHGVGASR